MNFMIAAPIDHDSRRFGFSLVLAIRTAAIAETSTARNGFIEATTTTIQSFSVLISSTFAVGFPLNIAITIASPTAASAAATVMIMKEKI